MSAPSVSWASTRLASTLPSCTPSWSKLFTFQQKLCANVVAQIMAFACGKQDDNPNKAFAGGRPSSIIIGDQLTPEALGALLAHFENKVMFQGFCWNVNSFDQEGVQLGKVLAKRVLAHETDGALKAYSDLLNI